MDTPSGVANSIPSAVDAKIQIVWPHGNLPVEQALKANVGVYLFEKGTSRSVPLSFDQLVRLWQALNNEPARQVAIGKKEYKTENGVTFPIWTFNNIDVSAALEVLNKYYFRVTVDGVPSFSNVWSHGKDARTYLPQPEIPRGVSPN